VRRLIIRPGGIGDCILALPAMEYLRADYTEVWVRSDVVPLVRFADRVRPIASTGLDLLGIGAADPPSTVAALRSFDSIVSWYGTNRPEFREEVARLGVTFEFLPALPSDGVMHAADYFLTQAGGRPPAIPRIDCDIVTLDVIAIQPFSGSPRKNWPLERFRELAARLSTQAEWYTGPDEKLEGALRVGDLYELAGRLASARAYVGNDSGITHLAAAAGASVVVLFGPTDPAIWGPRGERVRIVKGATMDDISVEAVASAVNELC